MTQVVSILESCSPEVVLFFELYEKGIAASDHAEDLLAKAGRVGVKARRKATKLQAELSEVWKSLRVDGENPADPQAVATTYKALQEARTTIRKALVKKKLDPKSRKVYRDAANLYASDQRALYEEKIAGHPITANNRIDPAILARLEEIRKAKSK